MHRRVNSDVAREELACHQEAKYLSSICRLERDVKSNGKSALPRCGRRVPSNESWVRIRSDAHAARVTTGEENSTAEDAEIAEVFVRSAPSAFFAVNLRSVHS